MTKAIAVDGTEMKHHGWRVTLAATGINLALGILNTWSVISNGIPGAWGWTAADTSLPYAFACLTFCITMMPAGRRQDRIGPRAVASAGGLPVGIGMILASFTTTPPGHPLHLTIIDLQ